MNSSFECKTLSSIKLENTLSPVSISQSRGNDNNQEQVYNCRCNSNWKNHRSCSALAVICGRGKGEATSSNTNTTLSTRTSIYIYIYISNFSIVRNVNISTIYHKPAFVLDRTGAAQLILSPFLQGRVGFNSFTNPLAAGSEAGNLSRFNTANLSRINQVIDDE